MNRTVFYDAIRGSLNLTTENVAGTEYLLDRMQESRVPTNKAADMLATGWWETGQRMQPIDEFGGATYFNTRYGPGTKVGKALGNTLAGDGARFHGRGYVQLTGRKNYARAGAKLGADFLANPELVKEPRFAWPIMLAGMSEGWFTGKDLSDYIDDIDESDAEDLREYVAARRVINGTDKAETIGKLALTFEKALRKAGYDPLAATVPLPRPPDDPGPGTPPVSPAEPTGGLSGLLGFFLLLAGAGIVIWLILTH